MTHGLTRDGRDKWLVPSATTAGVTHVVIRHAGHLTCSCPAGMNGRTCWHVKAVSAELLARSNAVVDHFEYYGGQGAPTRPTVTPELVARGAALLTKRAG